MIRTVCIIVLLLMFSEKIARTQCCASSGNPIGGTVNIGLLDKHALRIASFYRSSYSDKYLIGDKQYIGEIGILKRAVYNYIGLFSAYGITDKTTLEIETGYFINKTHIFKVNDEKLTGYGLSDLVVSLKPRIYYDSDKNFEISLALGSNIPFSRSLQQVDGVTLPIDVQPSSGSFGLVIQSNIIKENSFRALSFLLVNRIEKYFENKQNYTFGNSYSNSFYFSKHFFSDNQQLKGWTLILQLKNQIREKNCRAGQTIDASGNCLFFLIPQINLSLLDNWNISMLADIPVYQYYNEIQLANRISFALIINKDLTLNKKTL